jgi:hypothetical protein
VLVLRRRNIDLPIIIGLARLVLATTRTTFFTPRHLNSPTQTTDCGIEVCRSTPNVSFFRVELPIIGPTRKKVSGLIVEGLKLEEQ